MYSLYEYVGANVSPVLDTLDLVGLATIADVVPLVGENRALVKAGLRAMNSQNARPAIKVMLELTKREEVDSYTIGFLFAPMINALSRMGEDVRIATDILLSDDYDFLKKNVQRLIEINDAKKSETDREFEIAISKVDNKNLDSCIIVYDSSFREGIIGIVAGRLKSEFNRPTIVFAPSTKEGIIKASCRSIDAFHLKDNLDKIADIMIGYGGHAKAAGLSIRLEDFDLFKKSMLKMTDKIPVDSFIESIELDDVLTMNDITVENIEMLRLVEPYGESNQEPIFGLHLQYDAVKFMGEDDKHVKYWHRDSNVSVIEWNGGAKEKDRINSGKKRSKVIGSVSLNNFNGSLYPQFVIK